MLDKTYSPHVLNLAIGVQRLEVTTEFLAACVDS